MKIDKKSLRRQFIQQRQQLPIHVWQANSDRLCTQLQYCPQFIQAQTVLGYHSHHQEPDLTKLFANCAKQWGLPRCVDKDLLWHRWQPLAELVTGCYGILEPKSDSPLLEPAQIDLMLVPAVAIDRSGYRLGYGGGYYDRLRSDPAWARIPTIGIVFDFAYVDSLPIDPWDLSVDGICTEIGYSDFLRD